MRGAYRDRHDTRSGMRWTRSRRMTCGADADGQVVWSWRPWAGAKFVGDDPANDGDYEVTDTGGSTKQPLTPLRRECRCFGFTCGEFACVLLCFAHKAAGAAKHPAFPAPSLIGDAALSCKTRACGAARTRRRVFGASAWLLSDRLSRNDVATAANGTLVPILGVAKLLPGNLPGEGT